MFTKTVLSAISIALIAAPAQAVEESRHGLLQPPADAITAIPNFDTVTDNLLRGGAPSDKGLKTLSRHGVRTIIDLRMNPQKSRHEHKVAGKLGMTYIHMPMNYLEPSPAQLKEFLDIVQNPDYQPVYVHCRQGADRTGTVCAVYRILVQKWTLARAYKEMRAHGFKPWLFTLKHTVTSCQASSDI